MLEVKTGVYWRSYVESSCRNFTLGFVNRIVPEEHSCLDGSWMEVSMGGIESAITPSTKANKAFRNVLGTERGSRTILCSYFIRR